jgi:putative oxidoreductase
MDPINWLPGLMSRITLGWIFLESGWGKLHNISKVTEYFVSLGIPLAHFQAPLVSALEFGCGALLLIGLGTRMASLPLIGIMAVAIPTALWDDIDGLSSFLGTSEFLYILLLIWLVIYGAGIISIDFIIRRRFMQG